MTTKVVVDAHAGLSVKVIQVDPVTGNWIGEPHIVEPNTEKTFYVHSTLDLIVHEVQPDEQKGS